MSSADIPSILQLDKSSAEGRFFLVKEINGCDSSFISSCIIGHQIKKKKFTLLITFHNFMTHYQNVGLKMNYNLKRSVESELVEVYNPVDDLVNKFTHEGSEIDMSGIIMKIQSKIYTVIEKYGSVTVILEGVSHLFDLNFSLQEINIFLKNLIHTVRKQKESLLVLLCNVAGEDDSTCILANLLSYMSYITIEVENLATGRSADVSGHFTIKGIGNKFDLENEYALNTKMCQYHFKLFDRGIKLFVPGCL